MSEKTIEEVINNKELEKIINELNVKRIDTNKNYWLVRTQGGKYFQDFYFEDFIAIEYDQISLDLIKEQKEEEIKKEIESLYPDHKVPGLIVTHLDRFVNQMKAGDIILSPGKSSSVIAIGELVNDDIELLDEETALDWIEEEKCPYRLRRKVKWYKHIKRDELDLYLHKLINCHHAITNVNDYAHYIDRSLYDFFIKDNEAYITFMVQQHRNINAVDLISLINNILSSVDIFNEYTNANLDKKEIDIKINVQSPGPIELSGTIEILAIIAVLTVVIFGGKVSILKIIEFETEGIVKSLKKVIEAIELNRDKEWKEELQELIDRLKVQLPKISCEKIENNKNELEKNKESSND